MDAHLGGVDRVERSKTHLLAENFDTEAFYAALNAARSRFVMVGAMLYRVVRLQFRLQNAFKPDS